MAAQTITNLIAPRMEFSSPDAGSVLVRVFNSVGGIEWECGITTATWTAMAGALGGALAGATTPYIPKNVIPTPFNDGRLTSGGQLVPQIWGGAA